MKKIGGAIGSELFPNAGFLNDMGLTYGKYSTSSEDKNKKTPGKRGLIAGNG